MKSDIPSWLKQGLEALYLDSDEGGRQIRIEGSGSELTVNTKVIDDRDFREFYPDEEEPEWEETPVTEWQASYYGLFFIDVTRDLGAHRICSEPTEYLGMERASYESRSYVCFKLRILNEIDCICKTLKRRSTRSGQYGKCLTCRGILSSMTKCPACGGTGVCSFCHGKGRQVIEDIYWYEERTGILIKYERLVEDELVERERLIRLEPNVLDSDD